MKTTLCLILLCLSLSIGRAQYTELPQTQKKSINFKSSQFKDREFKPRKSFFKERIIPVALITTGILLSNSDFEKSLQNDIRSSVGKNFYTKVDDFTRYAPVVQMYAADILGAKSKNHWFDQTKNLVLASIISNGTSTILKKEIYKKRPGDEDIYSTHANSFPSGHTTTAFTTATVLFEEFKDSNTLLAYSGYAFAIATGGLRMMNNAHYLSDVLVGAGIGILATKLVYHFDYLLDWNPFEKMKGVAFAPQFGENFGLGFYVSKTF